MKILRKKSQAQKAQVVKPAETENEVQVIQDPKAACEQAVYRFLGTAPDVIGFGPTAELLNALSDNIISQPDIAIKLSKPETLKKINELGGKIKGKSIGELTFQIPGLISDFMKIMS